jgi:hypothetical protein
VMARFVMKFATPRVLLMTIVIAVLVSILYGWGLRSTDCRSSRGLLASTDFAFRRSRSVSLEFEMLV